MVIFHRVSCYNFGIFNDKTTIDDSSRVTLLITVMSKTVMMDHLQLTYVKDCVMLMVAGDS